MRVFDLDWALMLDFAGQWSALPLAARRVLLQKVLQASPSIHASRLGADAPALIDAGFAVRMVQNPAHVPRSTPSTRRR